MSGQTTRYWTFQRVIVALVLVVALAPFAWYVWNRGQQQIPRMPAAEVPPVEELLADDQTPYNLAGLVVPRERLHVAGPEWPQIAALSYPDTLTADEAAYLRGRDRLLVLEINGQVSAYPTRIVNYHEVVNDVVADVPVAVFYCPSTDSFSVADRRLDGRVLEFGPTRIIINGNTVFYDTTDHALWSQLAFGAVSGPFAGRMLAHVNTWRVDTFERFRDEHPDARILSDYTGQLHPYDRGPSRGEYGRGMMPGDESPFPLAAVDPAISWRSRVVGLAYPDGRRVAYLVDDIDGEFDDGVVRFRHNPRMRQLDLLAVPDGAAVTYARHYAWHAFYPDAPVVRR